MRCGGRHRRLTAEGSGTSWFCMCGFSLVPPKHVHVRLAGDSALTVGVSVCVSVMDWLPVQVYPASPPITAGIAPPPCNPELD